MNPKVDNWNANLYEGLSYTPCDHWMRLHGFAVRPIRAYPHT